MDIYYIEFYDTRYISCGWCETAEIGAVEPNICAAVGFVVYQDDKRVNLVLGHNLDDAIQGFAIPRGAISKMVLIPESAYMQTIQDPSLLRGLEDAKADRVSRVNLDEL